MSLPASSSESPASNIELLDERIQRWVWAKGWTSLRDAQELAIPILLEGQKDVIIAAATASGKTEAAFLPILSKLVRNGEEMGTALYISPLKALINDQWGRLDQLCEELEVPVVPWHGDISPTRKRRFMKRPQGVLLITPESLEAMFVLRGHEVRRFFGELEYVVVDELHAFIGSDRGKQLQSLLRRIEAAIERRVPRVGLSATLGDMGLAARFLRPGGAAAEIITSTAAGQELKVQLRGYLIEGMQETLVAEPVQAAESAAHASIADHLFKVLHGSNNLLFPNSRSKVEYYSDLLRRRCEREGIPNEFWPHHGSLSREIREDTEAALKAGDRPATAICTTTLELGIDIGAVRSVAQIGPPPSVAALRQRLGRSGRRPGEAAILRAYVMEHAVTSVSPLSDRLREGLLQSTATIRLLVERWCEPPRAGGLHLSTLVQQVLSMIAERGGVSATEVSRTLVAQGPFAGLVPRHLAALLREMGRRELVVQDSSGALLLGQLGERLVGSHDFYAAFASSEEWQIVQDGRALGTLPIDSPVFEGMCIIFGGRRWKILNVCAEPAVLTVAPDPSGRPPMFDSGRPMVHERIRVEMRKILEEDGDIGFLDAGAQGLLLEARKFYRDAQLPERMVVMDGKTVLVLSWAGDFANNALVLLLRSLGLETGSNDGLVVRCEGWGLDRLADACSDIVGLDEVDLLAMLKDVENIGQSKWDWALPRELLVQSYASMHLDIAGAKKIAARLMAER
ncbi:MAG: putative helicase [Gammaproteobacteria bacterium]|nr:putative helicase [Gammaproteobacteria bacterium]